MSSEKQKERTKNTLTTRTPNICNDFSGNPGDPVNWKSVPSNGCTVCQSQQHIPFTGGFASNGQGQFCVTLPTQSTITINANCPPGNYAYSVSCCTGEANKTVTVT
jgi:hypothetical protein